MKKEVRPVVTTCSHERHLWALKDRNEVVRYLRRCLKPHVEEFDAIAVSGYSMALVAPIIAHSLKKNIVLVRKEYETCASDHGVEGVHGQRCIIIDDLICSGESVRRVIRGCESISCTVVGSIMYCRRDQKYNMETKFPSLKNYGDQE